MKEWMNAWMEFIIPRIMEQLWCLPRSKRWLLASIFMEKGKIESSSDIWLCTYLRIYLPIYTYLPTYPPTYLVLPAFPTITRHLLLDVQNVMSEKGSIKKEGQCTRGIGMMRETRLKWPAKTDCTTNNVKLTSMILITSTWRHYEGKSAWDWSASR